MTTTIRSLPAALQRGPFTRQGAVQAGLDDRDLRSQLVRKLFTNVYIDASLPLTHEVWCRAALLRAPAEAAIAGVAALKLWDVMLPRRLQSVETIDLVLPESVHWPSRPPLRAIRPARAIDTRKQVVVPEEILPLLARFCSWLELVEIGDGLLRRQQPLTTIERLRSAVERADKSWGAKRLARAMPLIRPGTDSLPETDLRLIIVSAGFPEPTVNPPINTPNGLVFPDLAYVDQKIAIEYDGVAYHRSSDYDRQRDNQRDRCLRSITWDTLTATAADIASPERFLGDLERTLYSHGITTRVRRPFIFPAAR